ncbi:MAG TPA: thioredoxin family protein [Acidimicrobiia bacterium]
MATASTMLPLGTKVPDFTLPDVRTGESVSVGDFGEKGLLVVFICNHCPYVKLVQPGLVELGRDYRDRDVAIVGIAPNDAIAYPEDAPAELARVADRLGYEFPVLYDESQEVARAFTAACTPDFFLFDADRALVYRGQFDGSRPGNGVEVTGESVRAALEDLLADRPISDDQRPSLGCSIKWKAEGEAISLGKRQGGPN